MRAKYALLLPTILLLASCGYVVPSVKDVTIQAGQSTTITITEYQWLGGGFAPFGGGSVSSSDPNVLQLDQSPDLADTRVTLHALQPGTAYIQSTSFPQPFVTVHVEPCVPVSTRPQITEAQALVGPAIELRVFTDSPSIVPIWSEDRGGNWVPIPFATGNVYIFSPRASGTYRFLVRYAGDCGGETTLIT